MSNKEMLSKVAEIFTTGDLKSVGELFSSGYVDHQRPEWMTEEGADEFKAIVKLARESMPNLHVGVVGQVIEGQNMIAGILSWASENAERETIEMLRVEEGKFIEHWGAEVWSRPIVAAEK